MIFDKKYFVEVKFTMDASSGPDAIESLVRELRLLADSDVILSVVDENANQREDLFTEEY